MDLSHGSDSSNGINVKRVIQETIPDIVTKYDVHYTIGKGHFGNVLLATSKTRKQSPYYAIKLINAACKPENVENELIYLNAMRGAKNIVQYIEHFECDGNTAIVTKYFQGDNFKMTFRCFTPRDVQTYMKNLLVALAQVHSLRITHGDVKPNNFLFNLETNKFSLVDFGMAKPINSPLRGSGTLGYIAPESILAFERSSTAIDIWSTGAIFMILLSGIFPFFQGKAKEALKEFNQIFGTKNLTKFAITLRKSNSVDNILATEEILNPLDLKKICLLFRQYNRLYRTPEILTCPNCKQQRNLCLCAVSCNGDIDVLLEAPDPFPDSTYHLLRLMLQLDPTKRISASEALTHRFFREDLCSEKSHCESPDRKFKHGIIKALNSSNETIPLATTDVVVNKKSKNYNNNKQYNNT